MQKILSKKFLMLVTFIAATLMLYFMFVVSSYKLVSISGQWTLIEIRDTDQERQMGLSGRSSLCDRCGMLFVFDGDKQRGFWMKDMKFDIDIIWLQDGHIVHLEEYVSHQTPRKIYKPLVTADAVLELPSGKIDELDLAIKDRIKSLRRVF